MKEPTLLEKAQKAATAGKTLHEHEHSEVLDLMLAVLNRKVTVSQAASALGQNAANIPALCFRTLRIAVDAGTIVIAHTKNGKAT